MPEARRATSPLSSWTTQRWLTAGVTAALVALVVLGAAGAWMFARAAEAGVRLADVSSPALVAAVRLESGLVNQETGIRGYLLTGNRDFLTPYRTGRQQELDAAAVLRELVPPGSTADTDLDAVLARAQEWQTRFAEPAAASLPGSTVDPDGLNAEAGKAAFDALRAATAAQQDHLQADREVARDDVREAERVRDVVFTVIAAVIVLLAALAFAGLRAGVTRPLNRLSEDAERVAGGDFGHPIGASGPADLRRLSADVEGMRRRLVEELASGERTRSALDAQAADLRRSNAELEQFAYVASHDLQEPLRKVASFCQLLQRRYGGRLDDRADAYINFAVEGATRMQTLISDLLAFSRVGRVHAGQSRVDLEDVLETALGALSLSIEESGAVVTHDPLPRVEGDATQLGMLFQNLVGNAIKFRSADRPPRVHVGAERDGDAWRFSVTDNGIGIDPEFRHKVFLIFQRLHARDAYPGNGIGLAMCKKIVEFHNGEIDVDAGHAEGTRMVFTLGPFPAAEPASA